MCALEGRGSSPSAFHRYDRAMQPDGGARRVAVVIPDEVVVLDAAIPIDVFGSDPHYRLDVCAVSPEVPTSVPGLSCVAVAGLEALRHAHTVVVPGYASYETPPPDLVVRALRDAHGRGARMLSICTGAFALAAAGLLSNRPATTHWRATALLQSQYPDVEVHPDRLFVDDGDVLTSAGVTSGIDLCLHVVRKDIGAGAPHQTPPPASPRLQKKPPKYPHPRRGHTIPCA